MYISCQYSQVKCSALWTEEFSYIYERYQQEPIFITQCFMGWNESSDGSKTQYLSALKAKTYRCWVQRKVYFQYEFYVLQI